MGHEIIDGWSLIHFGAGAILGLMKLPRTSAYSLIIGYEIFENILKFENKDLFGDNESVKNIVVDTIVGIAGYELLNLKKN